jgi:hypothetical protein
MARRRSTAPPAQPAATDGAAAVRQYLVKLHDRQDGQGVDWRVIAETLFKAAFDGLDRLPEDQRRALALRVHEGAYRRAAGVFADGSGDDPSAVNDAVPAPSNAGPAVSRTPKPPRAGWEG